MLTCIACSKQIGGGGGGGSLHEREDEESSATPSKKQAIKALTAQIKDMALKASGAYRQCKPCSGAAGQHGNYTDSEAASASERFHCSYRRTGSSSSTPRLFGKEIIKGISSGEATPSMSSRTETGSTRAAVVFMEEDEPKEWVAQVEPGVLITFVSLPQGGNDLKRIRFRGVHCGGILESGEFNKVFDVLVLVNKEAFGGSMNLKSREVFEKIKILHMERGMNDL